MCPIAAAASAVLWDRTGKRYGRGAGLHVLADGQRIASAEKLRRLAARLPAAATARMANSPRRPSTIAVNNDGTYYPRITASYVDRQDLAGQG